MSDNGHYRGMPKSWEHESSDRSAGIMSDGITHLPCIDKEHSGGADLTGGGTTGLRLTGGYERFTEEWTCRDCQKMQMFWVDDFTGWDEPTREAVFSYVGGQIPVEVARDVLGYFGSVHGWEAGGFTTALMTAYGKADGHNRLRIAMGFPELSEAMRLAMDTTDGIALLIERVSS